MSILVVLSMVFAITPSFTLTARAAGSGTADDPFLIYTAADLITFRNTVNGGNTGYCGKLMNDINIGSAGSWTPIAQSNGYTGTFDGQGHTISGLTINWSGVANLGLFGVLSGGTITNVALASVNIVDGYNVDEKTYTTINIPEGYTQTSDGYVGYKWSGQGSDIVSGGTNYGRLQNYRAASVGRRDYWEFCGWGYDAWVNMNDAYTYGTWATGYNAIGPQYSAGGLVGYMTSGTIQLSSVSGTVNCNYANAGGLVGLMNGGTLKNSYSNGYVRGSKAGGAVGVINGGTVKDCYSTAAVDKFEKNETIYTINGSVQPQLIASWPANYHITSSLYITMATNCYKYVFSGSIDPATRTTHNGYMNGFAYSVNNAVVENAYYYNSSAVGKTFSTNLGSNRNTYILNSVTNLDSNEHNSSLSSDDFTIHNMFNNWDFHNTWVINDSKGRPVLYNVAGSEGIEKPWAVLPEGDDAVITITADSTSTEVINLYDYIKLNGGRSSEGKFTYSVTTGDDIASVSSDYMTIAAGLPKDNYTVTLHAFDSSDGIMDDFDVTFTIRAVQRVPAPELLAGDLKYSRSLVLGLIPITTGWRWRDDMTCPKTGKYAYPIFYQYEDGKAEFYDLTSVTNAGFTTTYDEEKNGVWAELEVETEVSDETPISFYTTVLDGDTDEPIEGAELSGEYEDFFPEGNTTKADGTIYSDIPRGEHEIAVHKDGYTDKVDTIKVVYPGTNAPIIRLVPVRTPYIAATVKDKDEDTVVDGATVTITKISDNKTGAWNDGSVSLTTKAGEDVEGGLPDGRYAVRSATDGYSHDDVTYIKVENGEVTYYTDALCTVRADDQAEAAILYATNLAEPTYDLLISKVNGEPAHYRATLSLKNIKATYGTFGIHWDTDLFTFDPATGIHLGTDIKGGLTTPESSLLYNKTWTNDLGYYDFVWSANNGNDSVVDAELEAKTIATFDFYLKNADIALADMITVDTFSIQPWTDTKAAREWAAAKKAENPDFDPKFWEYWRECDTDNLRNNLKPGRIDAIYSVVNGVETNGFFQVAVNGDLGGSDPSSFYDAKTDLRYDFDIKNSVIRFHVTDKYKGDEIENARIRLFERTATRVLGQKNTNYLGRANFTVNTANTDSPEFAYDVLLKGYWPIPESGLTGDRPHIGAETGKATEVEVLLEKKIYHDTEIKGYGAQTLDLVKSADLGGERYAYNNRDFHFRIKGAKGFRITKYPTKAYVTIGDEDAGSTKVENLELSPNENGLFTLPAEYLIQDEISIEKMNALGYEDVPLVQPDDEGFRSYNIEVQFDNFEVMELDYLVEGMTNEHGTVTYKADTPFADGLEPFVPDAYAGTKEHDIKVKTKKSVRDENDKTIILEAANHKTGTFTFEADEGYMVEKVYVNGLQIHTYDDLKKFTYTFGDVDMDCSIIVMFWDGETPSTDSVLTLVVGDWGYVHVSSPVAEDDLMCTRRTYLNPEENLEFKTDAAKFSDDYELYRVEKEVEGEPRVNITGLNTDGKYSVEPVEGKNVVTYVTFKNRLAEITPTLFVKSYVYFGEGVADPAGILIYNYYDSVEIDMTADAENSWLVRGAMISPYEDLEDISEFEFEEKKPQNTYRYDSLQENIAIGAVFMEKAYPIQGLVDLSQRSNITSAAPLRGATITFVRLEQDEETGEWVEKTKQVPFKTDSTASRTDSVFSTELPVGKWNVYVSKQGYMTYKLTEFDMPGPTNETDVYLFGTPDGKSGTQQKVVPYIGSTETGDSISLTDAANVKSGMRGGVSKTIFNMADVDNNNSADHIDLAYVWKNFNTRMIVQDYATFCNEGSATPSAN